MQSLIYKIDDILLLKNLIKYGCVKVLTTFCCTDKHFYKIFVNNRDEYYKILIYLRYISPSYFERFHKFDKDYIIHMKIPINHYKYDSKEKFIYQPSSAYYTFYPSNTKLVISNSESESEKKLFDLDIIEWDYFKNSTGTKDIKHNLLFYNLNWTSR